MVFFVGNILPSHEHAASHREAGDRTFHISPAEAPELDVTGLPVRLEHADALTIGRVVRSWDADNGSKWVIGEVDNDSVEGGFACNDLLSNDRIYTGLSLQHLYREYSDGSHDKEALEVSLCKVPRRDGCNITAVVSASAKSQYKHGCGKNGNMTTTEEQKKNEAEPVATEEVSASTTTPPAAQESGSDELTAAMAETVRMHEALKLAQEQNAKLQAQMDETKRASEEALAAKVEASQSHIQKMADAVMARVCATDPSLSKIETEKAIQILKDKYPSECEKVMQIACCASNRAAELEGKLAMAEKEYERKLLERKYTAAVQQRAGCHPSVPEPSVVTEEPVQASNKRARTEAAPNPFVANVAPSSASVYSQEVDYSSAQNIRDAYHNLRGRGSMLDNMSELSKIGTRRR